MATPELLRIGTRGSPLSLAQAHEVRARLAAAMPELSANCVLQVVAIKTTGDSVTARALADIGGKGLFSKEIDTAQLDGRIDIAVHSAKDLETRLADGIELSAVLEREDPRDAIICRDAPGLDGLTPGAIVGTASLRRQAQILHRRPDLKVALIRGNVQTRLSKLEAGECDATLLALAGLNRLGLANVATEVLDPEVLLPAVAQGAIGITCRIGDRRAAECIAAINHADSMTRVTAERAMLEALDGSCRTPIGGLATLEGDRLTLRGLVAREDGSDLFGTTRVGVVGDARRIGRDAGEELRRRASDDLFD